MGPRSRGPARVPPPGPSLYLHVTQLHAQIQLSVSLSPVDVRRQHLILHGHTAQSEMRLGSLRLATRWCAAGACRTQAANPRAPACQQPAASSLQTPHARGPRLRNDRRGRQRGLQGLARAGRGREGAGPRASDVQRLAAATSGVTISRCTALLSFL